MTTTALDRTPAKIAVYIVTFRRHEMLKRAIASVLNQTFANIVVRVINDDPDDEAVGDIVLSARDHRISLYQPVAKRGAAANFNIAYSESSAGFVSVLEDDNWWEPRFLESQLVALEKFKDARLVVGNERLWLERADGSWQDLQKQIWPFSETKVHSLSAAEICGSAKICNSAMLVRTDAGDALLTPNTIPVDVTEHFRERLLQSAVILNGEVLVNYAQTQKSARTRSAEIWGSYQCLLIGSVFAALSSKKGGRSLARQLWSDCQSPLSPRANSLIAAGIAIEQARTLLWCAPPAALLRFLVWLVRVPTRLFGLFSLRARLAREFRFLVEAPLTQHLAREFERGI